MKWRMICEHITCNVATSLRPGTFLANKSIIAPTYVQAFPFNNRTICLQSNIFHQNDTNNARKCERWRLRPAKCTQHLCPSSPALCPHMLIAEPHSTQPRPNNVHETLNYWHYLALWYTFKICYLTKECIVGEMSWGWGLASHLFIPCRAGHHLCNLL